MTTNVPSFVSVAQTELWIVAFFITKSEHLCKWGIKYAHLVTTNLVGNTCARHNTTHTPSFITVAHTKLWIFTFLVIRQSEQICNWGIKYAHLVTTDHMGGTWVHHYQHTKFRHCSLYRILDIISQSKQTCKWGIEYVHSVTTDHVCGTCAHFRHCSHTKLWIFAFFVIS